jgi:hypothetical protein
MYLCNLKRLCFVALLASLSLSLYAIASSWAGPPVQFSKPGWLYWHHGKDCAVEPPISEPGAGSWYWVPSPEEEGRRVASLYNRYCIRCHGCDGRGIWDIPDVPDFTCVGWQASKSDAQLTRLILEGRGAVMPAFRGTLSLEESAALARYLRRFGQTHEMDRLDETSLIHRLPNVKF